MNTCKFTQTQTHVQTDEDTARTIDTHTFTYKSTGACSGRLYTIHMDTRTYVCIQTSTPINTYKYTFTNKYTYKYI